MHGGGHALFKFGHVNGSSFNDPAASATKRIALNMGLGSGSSLAAPKSEEVR
ncbi:hypothetical protein Rcae01_04365 [Novipirellula caenicola]|uniref:Uncharacterized protein n=1 Tax=Novipirellula caenicola TaxID=1536901 RepID=A0ABP9VW36_9BACT